MPETATRPPRVLLDVDVVLDVLTQREPFFADSAALLAACETGRCEGYVASHTITTLWYLLAKHRNATHARTRVSDLLQIVRVAPVDEDAIRRAMDASLPDFEDGVQIAAAARIEADYVATRNLADFSKGSVPALSPAELLPLLDAPA